MSPKTENLWHWRLVAPADRKQSLSYFKWPCSRLATALIYRTHSYRIFTYQLNHT